MRTLNLAQESEKSLVALLALPAMAGQLVNVLYSIVDRVYIGHLPSGGDIALGAIGIAAPLITLLSSPAYLVGIGGAPIMMMRLGAGKKDDAQKILNNAFIMLLFFGIIIPLICLAFLKQILLLIGATPSVLPLSESYMQIYLIGSVFAIIGTGLAQFITAQGFSDVSMISMCLGAFINVVLDPIFIFKFNMGIRGAAIATAIAQCASCILNLLFMFGTRSRLSIKLDKPDFNCIGKIALYGFSPFLIYMTYSIVIIAINAALKRAAGINADQCISAYTICCSLIQLVTMPLLGISGGTGGLLSYNYGAGNAERVKRSEKIIFVWGLAFTSLCFLLSIFFSRFMCSLFTPDEALIDLASHYLKISIAPIIILSAQYVFVDGLTALGFPVQASLLSFNRKLVMIGSTFILPAFFGPVGAVYASALGDICGPIVSTIVFLIIFPKILRKCEKAA